MRQALCHWHCGRPTKNISRICDDCWRNREAIYQARMAREAAAEKKPMSDKQRAALERANTARTGKVIEANAIRHAAESEDKGKGRVYH